MDSLLRQFRKITRWRKKALFQILFPLNIWETGSFSVSLKFPAKIWRENDDAIIFPASARVLTITDCALRDSTIASQKSTSARSKFNEFESYRS